MILSRAFRIGESDSRLIPGNGKIMDLGILFGKHITAEQVY